MVADEAAELAERGQMAPTLRLRLALAYLHSIADGPTFELRSRRYIFDQFWYKVTKPNGGGNRNSDLGARRSYANTTLKQIGRQLGHTPNLFNVVRAKRCPDIAPQYLLKVAWRPAHDERDRAKWRKRRGYFGRLYPGDDERER